VLALGLILHRYHLIPLDDYRLQIAESLTLKPRGFELRPRRRHSAVMGASMGSSCAPSHSRRIGISQ